MHAASGKRRKRFRRLAAKAKRLARIRSIAGRRAPQIFVAGPMAEAVYGAAVNGLSDKEVIALRRAAALAYSPRARGRSLTTLLLMAGAPTWKGEVECILQYSRQVWQATCLGQAQPSGSGLTLPQIARIWRNVDPSDALGSSGRRRWDRVRGPISAMYLTLDRIGWKMCGPFALTDHAGEEIILTRTSPALLGQMLRRAVLRTMETKVGLALAAKGDGAYSGRRAAVDHVVAQLARDRTLSAADKAAYRSVACGAVMTYARAKQEGYMVEDACPLCGARGDTLRHRIWCCQHPEAVAARCSAAPRWVRQEAERRSADDTFWTNALIPHPADVWPAPAAQPQAVTQFGGGTGVRPEEEDGTHDRPRLRGRVFGDGSCTTHLFPELRRAATSICQRLENGGKGWTIQCPVPRPLPQTPQAAEHIVLALAQRFAHPADSADIASDCAGVVKAFNGPPRDAVGPKRVYAGLMREAIGDTAWRRRTSVRKVKAHVSPDATTSASDRADAEDNNWADELAKEAVDLHPQPPPALETELAAAIKRAKHVVRTIAKVIQVFPPMPRERMVRPPVAREGARTNIEGAHQWEFVAGFWRCRQCLKLTLRDDLTPELACQRCNGPKAKLAAEAVVAAGHALACTEGGSRVLFCTRCGAFSARRAYGLGARCLGAPKPSGKQALARIRRGLEPWETRGEGGRFRRRIGAPMAWDENSQAYIASGPSTVGERRGRKSKAVAARAGTSPLCRPTVARRSLPERGGGPVGEVVGNGGEAEAGGGEVQITHAAADAPTTDDMDETLLATSVPHGAQGDEKDEPGRKRLRLCRVATTDDAEDLEMRRTDGEALEGCGPRVRCDHRHDHLPDDQGCHRLDGAREPRDAPAHLPQRRRRVDEPADDEGPTHPARPRCGPAVGGSTSGSAWDGSDSISMSRASRNSETVDDRHGSSAASGDQINPPPNPHPRLRPPPRLPPEPGRAHGAPAANGHELVRPRQHDAHVEHAPQPGGFEDDDVDSWRRPWGGSPHWLYLPHLGAGGGADALLAARCAKRRRLDEHISAGADSRGDRDVGEHAPRQLGRQASIRGRADGAVQPPGAAACGSASGHAAVQQIRGQRPLPGANVYAGDEQRARLVAQLAARNSLIQRSLDDHAERVAKKARGVPGPATVTAEARMAALRQRVAARGAASSRGEDTVADSVRRSLLAANADAAHMASRAAHHAVLGRPAGGDR